MNAYPPEADGIAIPIFSELILWFLATPLVIAGLVTTLKDYKGSVAIFQKRFFAQQFMWVNVFSGILLSLILLSLDMFLRMRMSLL